MDTLDRKSDSLDRPGRENAERWAVVILWNRRRAEGIGDVAWLDGNHPHLVGRAGGGGENRVRWTRALNTPGVGIGGSYVSRQALELTPIGPHAVGARNVGRLTLRVNGHPISHASLSNGDVLELDGELVLLLQRRSPLPMRDGWGQPDADGMVGEGPAMSRLRQRITQVA